MSDVILKCSLCPATSELLGKDYVFIRLFGKLFCKKCANGLTECPNCNKRSVSKEWCFYFYTSSKRKICKNSDCYWMEKPPKILLCHICSNDMEFGMLIQGHPICTHCISKNSPTNVDTSSPSDWKINEGDHYLTYCKTSIK